MEHKVKFGWIFKKGSELLSNFLLDLFYITPPMGELIHPVLCH